MTLDLRSDDTPYAQARISCDTLALWSYGAATLMTLSSLQTWTYVSPYCRYCTYCTVHGYSKEEQLRLDKVTTEQLPQFRTDDPLPCLLPLVALLTSFAIVHPIWLLAKAAGTRTLATCGARAAVIRVAAGLGVVVCVATQSRPMPKTRRWEVIFLVDGIDGASETME